MEKTAIVLLQVTSEPLIPCQDVKGVLIGPGPTADPYDISLS